MIARLLRALGLIEALCAWGIAAALHEHGGLEWAGAAAIGIASPLLVHLGVVAAGFGLSARDAAAGTAGHPLGGAAYAAMILREFAVSVRAFQFGMSWMAWRALPGTALPTGAAGRAVPVLLIHGYGCNRQVWRPMAEALARAGHPIDAIDLEPPLGDIDGYAAPIADAVRRLRERCGSERVALVCHSMGGLAARAYLRAFGSDVVAAVITLGSPHRGTRHARFGLGRNAAQMRFASPWLAELAATETAAQRARFTVVLSLHDNIVTPQAAQVLPHASVVALRGIGHMALLADRRVIHIVSDALSGIRSGSPASAAGTPPGRR